MSKKSEIRDFRDAVAARLLDQVEGIIPDEVIVSREGDLYTKIDQAVAKAGRGLAVTVGPGTGSNESSENKDLIFRVNYEVTIWHFPLYQYDEETGEDLGDAVINEEGLRDAIIKSLWGKWDPKSVSSERIKVTGFRPGTDPKANVIIITIQRQHNLEN